MNPYSLTDVQEILTQIEFLMPSEEVLPVLTAQYFEHDILVLYDVAGEIYEHRVRLPLIFENISYILDDISKKGRIIALIHTHLPQSVMPSLPDLQFAEYMQLKYNRDAVFCIVSLHDIHDRTYYTYTMFNVHEVIASILREIEKEYKRYFELQVVEPVMEIPVLVAEDTVEYYPVYKGEDAVRIDTDLMLIYQKYNAMAVIDYGHIEKIE